MIRDEALSQMDLEQGLFAKDTENLSETGEWKQFDLYHQGKRFKKFI